MCGIAGIYGRESDRNKRVRNMLKKLQHRGYDSNGFYEDEEIALGHMRLAIVGIDNGIQPVFNETETIIAITNGEIYNHYELQKELKKKGHQFEDACDTNLIPHLYEEYQCKMFEKINGQFAIVIWDKIKKKVIMARDKFGEKPLYYMEKENVLYFSSEIAPLLEYTTDAAVNIQSLIDISTVWSAIGEKTFYEEIKKVDSGSYLVYDGVIQKKKYFIPNFAKIQDSTKTNQKMLSYELEQLLLSSVKERMDTDVPVAFYLSGGLDSSLLISMSERQSEKKIDTFSIAFENSSIDERRYQHMVSDKLNTNHHQVIVSEQDIIDGFFDLMPYVQTPVMRLGAIPMYLLSKAVHNNGFKVAISGEGADELFGGYDIFKEVKIREFCERDSTHKERAVLYKCTNSFVSGFDINNYSALNTFYNQFHSSDMFSSHMLRFSYGRYVKQFFTNEIKKEVEQYQVVEELKKRLPEQYDSFTNISKAQFLEIDTFLADYLLSSQGDRASMANTVECRYPFLDEKVVKFAFQLEDKYKVNILNEKYLLKQVAKKYLPAEITNRTKFPYRAMITGKYLFKDERVLWALSEQNIKQAGIFNVDVISKFLKRLKEKIIFTEKEMMLVTFVLSTQVLANHNGGAILLEKV